MTSLRHTQRNSIDIYIVKAEDLGDFRVLVYFNDHKTRQIDIGDFIRRNPHPQYMKYLKPEKFRKFSIEHGNLVWGKNWDLIFPVDQLYHGRI